MNYDVRISNLKTDPNEKIRAYASVNLDGQIAITGLKVMTGEHGNFVAMPSYKTQNGYKDVCFPITKEAREELNSAVLDKYQTQLQQLGKQIQEQLGTPTQSFEQTMS